MASIKVTSKSLPNLIAQIRVYQGEGYSLEDIWYKGYFFLTFYATLSQRAKDLAALTTRLASATDGLQVVISSLRGLSVPQFSPVFLTKEVDPMSALDDAMQAMTDEVTSVEGVEASASLLITSLAAQLKAAGTDPAKLTALHDRMKTSADALAAAVAANSPAPPAPTPAPKPGP